MLHSAKEPIHRKNNYNTQAQHQRPNDSKTWSYTCRKSFQIESAPWEEYDTEQQ
jgi:hypothetical protein